MNSIEKDANGINSGSQTILCASLFVETNYMKAIIGNVTLILLISLLASLIFRFSKNMHLFPSKGRSPRLALFQAIMFLLSLSIAYVTDLIALFEVDWRASSTNEIVFSRSFFKALYTSFRLTCYPIFLLRLIVISAHWKKSRMNTLMWTLFKSETLSILVEKP